MLDQYVSQWGGGAKRHYEGLALKPMTGATTHTQTHRTEINTPLR